MKRRGRAMLVGGRKDMRWNLKGAAGRSRGARENLAA